MKELIALRTITGILGTYEKLKTKLENAILTLKEIQASNKDKIKKLENKNKDLDVEIEKAESFKSSLEKMLN